MNLKLVKYLLVLTLLEFCNHTILHDMINPEIDRLYDDESLDDGSNNFDRFPLPYFDSIRLDPKKMIIE